ncbi:hypothetical protein ACE1ET_09495 [Saccharicrinis sp. FJH62]|uniref:hypothetical protein n=1 Tax=Saccharicrinis sp. FJH62 TaxID=3344657 RepID=UPI0035D4FC43
MRHYKMLRIMKVSILTLVLLIMNSFSYMNGQSDSDFVTPTPQGNFIFLGDKIPVQGQYIVERGTGTEERFTTIGEVQLSGNRQDLNDKLRENISLFPVFSDVLLVYSDSVINYPDTHSDITMFRYKVYPAALLTLGVAFLDTETEPGKSYRYRVHYEDANGNSDDVKTSTSVDPKQVPEFVSLNYYGVNETEDRIEISWYFFRDQHKNEMAKLNTFRRIYGKGDFIPVQGTTEISNIEGDTVFVTLTDTSIVPNSMYEYTVAPVDLFGNTGKSCKPVIANSFQKVPDISFRKLEAVSLKKGYGIRLSWELDPVPLARSICIYRSQDYDGNYERLAEIPVQDTGYTDYVTTAMENYYYYLTVNTAIGESHPGIRFSGLYNGSDIPLPPQIFYGEPEGKGVKLFFTSNEENVSGFYVYRASGYMDTLQQISDLVLKTDSFTTYIDSSRSLSGKFSYTYAVKSVNDVYLTSEFTEKIMVRPGLPTHIANPGRLMLSEMKNGISLSWEDLTQRENALGGYEVFRKDTSNKDFKLIYKQSPGTVMNYYMDTTVIPGQPYTYAVKAFNLFGAYSSFSNTATKTFRDIKPGIPSMPELQTRDNAILISWGAVYNPDIEHYRIYRYESNTEPFMLEVTDSKTLSFMDKNVKQGVLYFYFITAVDKYGRESNQSRIVTLDM